MQEGVLIKWLSTIKNMSDEGTLTVEKMELDEKDSRSRRARSRRWKPIRWCWRWGRTWTCRCSMACRADDQGRHGSSRSEHDDGTCGNLRRRRHGAVERTVTVGVGHGKKAARHIDAGCARPPRPAAEARAGRLRQAQSLVLRRRAEDRAAGPRARPPHVDLRRGRERPRRDQCAVRGSPLPVVRQLFRMRQLLWRLPRQRGDQAGPGKRFAFNFDYCKGCGICVSECPCGAIKMVPETI